MNFSSIFTGGVCCLLSLNAFAISNFKDVDWNYQVTSGDFALGTSWNGGAVPTSSQSAKFKTNGEYDITLSGNKQVAALWAQSSNGVLKIRFDLGAYTLSGGGSNWANQFVIFGTSGTDMEVTSGKIDKFSNVRVGAVDNGLNTVTANNNRFAISGAGTTFTCLGGKEITSIGSKGANNKIEVLDGAKYYAGSGTIIGENADTANLNMLRVSGVGSSYRTYPGHNTSSYNWLPKNGTHNKVIIENGGLFYNSGDEGTAARRIFTASESNAANNEFIVRGNGSLVDLNTDFLHGYKGSDNLLAVTNSARMNVKYKFFVGCASTAKRNKVLIGDGSIFSNHNHVVIGDASTSNEVTVTGAGSIFKNTNWDITVGNNASYNVLRVADGAYLYGNRHFTVGGPSNMKDQGTASTTTTALSTGNMAIFEGNGTGAYLNNNYTDIGWAGTNNLFIVRDGASVTNRSSIRIGYLGGESYQNGVIVSNASLIAKDGVYVNNHGSKNYFIAQDGAKVSVDGTFCVGVNAAASDGKVVVSGEGTTMNIKQSFNVGRTGGNNNTFEVKDGASVVVNDQMYIGRSSTSGSALKIFNGSFSEGNSAYIMLNLYQNTKFSFGGSSANISVDAICAHGNNDFEFVFDENGVAPLEVREDFKILDDNFIPTIASITVDARAFVKADKFGSFNIMEDIRDRSVKTVSGTELSKQSADVIAAANEALRSRITCIPDNVEVTRVDLAKSLIEVRVKNIGLSIIIR